MKIGIPKEIKTREGRVAMTPVGVRTLVHHGHEVFVEKGAGLGSCIPDAAFDQAGACMIDKAERIWADVEMVVKVKEPIEAEYGYMREGLILFTYLHLAANERLTRELLSRRVIGIAYETIQLDDGSLPLLAPMSSVAGRLAIQVGCTCLETIHGGKGILLSGVPGVRPGRVVIIGAGVSGLNAAHLAVGMGAQVTILDINQKRLNYLEDIFHSRAVTLMANAGNVEESVMNADLVIGSVLIAGAQTPHLITRELLRKMEPGSVIVDIAIDQGGCAETSRPTTHDNPTYVEEGIVHYCVANMPGAVPRTSTYALTNATMPFVLEIADKGWEVALRENLPLSKGLNVVKGNLTNRKVAEALGMNCSVYR
ncbi:MAG TPA: alanine dehydrogenase [Deltaproteobacteria bacterium]|nr:alanine dehydrogenase [Deltaproteobacteria bacterium]HPR54730.1 alanine dehydrogenase [Deltaproteobacteria bacterium]HXK48531.1 alanine dehydrogenase [Deltaproteobacteria bacterium]